MTREISMICLFSSPSPPLLLLFPLAPLRSFFSPSLLELAARRSTGYRNRREFRAVIEHEERGTDFYSKFQIFGHSYDATSPRPRAVTGSRAVPRSRIRYVDVSCSLLLWIISSL